jgi:hypothetical protein
LPDFPTSRLAATRPEKNSARTHNPLGNRLPHFALDCERRVPLLAAGRVRTRIIRENRRLGGAPPQLTEH